MRDVLVRVVLCCCVVIIANVARAQAPEIGPCVSPEWSGDAQTVLGWVFADPVDPGNTAPLTGWDVFIGDPPAPAWDYDDTRVVFGHPDHWHIQIPNVVDLAGYTSYWLCFVFERDVDYGGNYVYRDMDWTPFDTEQNNTFSEEWFDATGASTANSDLGVYSRMLFTGDMYPSASAFDIWLGVVGNGTSSDGDAVWEVLEVYLMALPVSSEIFTDGFELGNTSAWSLTVP